MLTAVGQDRVPEDLAERYIYQVVYDLRDAFAEKTANGFMRHVSEGFYGGRTRLRSSPSSTSGSAIPVTRP